jgi:hypothetical protein
MAQTTRPFSQTFGLFCLLIGQSLMLLSTFFWHDTGRYTVNASVLIILSMVFWSVGFAYLFSLFAERNPWYSRFGLLYAMYGCLGGIAFGFEGIYTELFNVSEKAGLIAYEKFPLQMNIVLFWSGPAFPLTIIALGVMWVVRHVGPWYAGLFLILGGAAFPLSRILRIENVAHAGDGVLLLGLGLIAWQTVASNKSANTHPGT